MKRALNEDGERVGPQGTPVEWVEEESYFFRLSAYQERLLDLYARHPDYVLPKERLNEVVSFVRGGLQDLSISRTTFDWGVKVPGNPKHVMYVWVDALTNYITAVGYPDVDSEKFRALLAGRSARDRKGHRAFSCGLLAGFPAFGGRRGAAADLLPRLSLQSGGEDVKVGRQRDRSRLPSPTPTASISCGISSCARSRSGRTAITVMRRSSTASTPTSPMISAISPSARRPWLHGSLAACCPNLVRYPVPTRKSWPPPTA